MDAKPSVSIEAIFSGTFSVELVLFLTILSILKLVSTPVHVQERLQSGSQESPSSIFNSLCEDAVASLGLDGQP